MPERKSEYSDASESRRDGGEGLSAADGYVEPFASSARGLEPEPEEGATNPLLLLHRNLRGRYCIALFLGVLLASVLAPVAYHSVRPKYESRGVVRVAPTKTRILYESEDNELMPLFDSFVSAQATYLTSRKVVSRAVGSPSLREIGWSEGREGVKQILQSLRVERRSRSELIEVVAANSDPGVAVLLVNSVLDAYESLYGEAAGQTVSIRERTLEARQGELERRLQEIDRQTLEEGQEYGPETLRKAHASKIDELERLDGKASELTSAIAQKESTRGKQSVDDLAKGEIVRLTVLDNAMANLIFERSKIAADLAVKAHFFGELDPEYVKLQKPLAIFDEAIEARRAQLATLAETGLLTTLGDDGEESIDQLQTLRDLVVKNRESVRAEARELNRRRQRIESFTRERGKLEHLLDQTKLRLESVRLETRNSLPGRVTVAIRGDQPLGPTSDKRKVMAVAGAGAGGFSGLAFVVLFGLLRQRCRYSDDVDTGGGHSAVVGVIPGFVRDGCALDASFENAVHQLRNVLQARVPLGGGGTVIAVTSAESGAGKTLISLELARSLARAGLRTVAVDADLVTASLSDRLRAAEKAGLREAVASQTIASSVHSTESTNLEVVPVGLDGGLTASHLSRINFWGVLDQLRECYDAVVIDTGTIGQSLEAGLAAALADEVLLVVRAGDSGRVVRRSRAALAALVSGDQVVVFNGARASDPGLVGRDLRAAKGADRKPRKRKNQRKRSTHGEEA